MVPIRPGVSRIRIESRRSPRVSWIYIEKASDDLIRVSLQRSPFATFLCSVEVVALPAVVVHVLMLFHRWPAAQVRCGKVEKKVVLRRE